MKKNATGNIDELAFRAFADLIEESMKVGSAPSADSRNAPTVAPVPEYRLAFRMNDRKDAFRGNAIPEGGPDLFPFVAAALVLFMLVPALFGGSRPTIEESFASARDSGELAVFTDGFKNTMMRVSHTLLQ